MNTAANPSVSAVLDPEIDTARGELKAWAAAIASVTQCAQLATGSPLPDAQPNPSVSRMREAVLSVQNWSRAWMTRLRPALVSTIPSDMIGYCDTFDAQTQRLIRALDAPAAPAPSEVKPVFAALRHDIRARIDRTAALYSEIALESSALTTAFRTLRSAKDEAVRAVQLDEQQFENMLIEYRTVCASRDAGDELLAFFAAPPTESPLMVHLAAINPTVGATRLVVQIGLKIASLFGASDPVENTRQRAARLDDLRRAMTEEQRRVAGLRIILDSVQPLLGVADEAVRASAEILKFWKALEAKLGSALAALEKGDGQGSALVSRIHVETARLSWRQLADYARGLKLD